MEIQLNTDTAIPGNESFKRYLDMLIGEQLSNFSSHITRIEVHLFDENGYSTDEADKRCILEARLKNRQVVAVSSDANTVEQAVSNALEELRSSLETKSSRIGLY